jgi:dUTP pyrophosphatase
MKNVLRIFVNPEYPELVEIYKKAVENHKENMKKGFPDSGFDLYVPQDEVFGYDSLMKTKMIDFQIKTEMKCQSVYSGGNGFFDRSKAFYLYPRSSLSKTPLMLSNHVGIVDSGYRGNLMGAFRCLYKEEKEDSYLVSKHTRLVQVCMASLDPFEVELVEKVEDLSTTERGEGGFGSTTGVVEMPVFNFVP